MQKIPLKKIMFAGLGITSLSAGIVATAQISANVNSQNAIKGRQQGVEAIAKYQYVDNCQTNPATESVKIGSIIPDNGKGTIPTSCVRVPATKQYLYVGYKDGNVTVLYVYTDTEVKNQLSQQKKG
jgi:hypothetical protein